MRQARTFHFRNAITPCYGARVCREFLAVYISGVTKGCDFGIFSGVVKEAFCAIRKLKACVNREMKQRRSRLQAQLAEKSGVEVEAVVCF